MPAARKSQQDMIAEAVAQAMATALPAALAAAQAPPADEKPAPKRRKAETEAKGREAKGRTRKLDNGNAEGYPVPGGHVITSHAKGLHVDGSRFRPEGKLRSLPRNVVEAMESHGDELRAVIAHVGTGVLPWDDATIAHVQEHATDILVSMDEADAAAGIGEYVDAS